MALIHPPHRMVHHHYPRTGGTNVRITLGKCSEWPSSHASADTYSEALKFKHGQTELERIARITLESYLWIGIVRDPYETIVSQFETIKSIPANCTLGQMTFKEYLVSGFVKKEIPFFRLGGFEYLNYTDHWSLKTNGRKLRIFRFELEEDWVELQKFIKKKVIVERPHYGAAGGRKPKEEYYTKETADLVTRIFEPDLERFGYERFSP